MFGYERNTFPKLTRRLEKAPQATISALIAPGISTATSTALFFNSIREPGNIAEIRKLTGNLFKTAKHQYVKIISKPAIPRDKRGIAKHKKIFVDFIYRTV